MSPAGTFPVAGEAAPDFTLAATSGSDVTLSSLRGSKVLLAFFPLAFTSTCTSELCDMSEDHGDFSGEDTVVLAHAWSPFPSGLGPLCRSSGPRATLEAARISGSQPC